MSVRAQLAAQLARFDDDAFAALANRGLLRRAQKDLEKAAVTIAEETPDALTVAVGEQRIRFDARGPAHARCSCPANGVCQHILAAAIALQRMEAPAPSGEGRSAPAAPDALSELQDALLAFTPAQLARHAGKPGYRWAWQFVQDLEPEQGLRVAGDAHLVLSFAHPRVTFHYMGGDLANLIADTDLPQVEKYRVAVVLALRRTLGQEIAPPEAPARAAAPSLDFGKDHAVAEAPVQVTTESRERLRASAAQLLRECVELGLSHLSSGMQERFATLAVWAQGAEYHRLALLLRRLADHVELLLDRAGGADEHRLFEELAVANALLEALSAAAARGEAPTHLVGRARTRYTETGSLELLGLGASAWRSASGYVGLTMLFWSPADRAFVSCTDARPESQRLFRPDARYKAAGPWSGLGAPEQVTGRRVRLTGAQLNAGGRLSAAEATVAAMLPQEPATDFAAALGVTRSWAQVAQQRGAQRQSLLAEPQPMRDWFVLAPARFGPPVFDGNRQALVWPLFDEDGQRLDAELVYGEYAKHPIERIEQLAADGVPAGTLLVGRVRSGVTGLVIEPLSLVRPHARPGEAVVDALYFEPLPQKGFISSWLSRRKRASEDPGVESAPASGPALPPLLREHGHWLARQAERGCSAEGAVRVRQESAAWAERLATAGFGTFRALTRGTEQAAVLLLRQQFVAMQHQRLLDAGMEAAET